MFFNKAPHPHNEEEVFFLDTGCFLQEKSGDAKDADLARAFIDSLPFQKVLQRLRRLGPCLCCHYLTEEEEARKVSSELGQIMRYVRYDSLENTRVLERYQELKHSRLQRAQNLTGSLKSTCYPEKVKNALRACRKIGQEFAYCCRTHRLWFSRHSELPKFLRHLSKKLKAQGVALQLQRPSDQDLAMLPYSTPVQMLQTHGEDGEKKIWELLAQSGST